jgi:hypothetical protein
MLRFCNALPVIALAACSSSPSNSDAFATFQACYMEHHITENFSPMCAVEICCISHQIGNTKMNIVCGDTTQTCESYVTANVTDTSDPNLTSDIQMACSNYPFDSGRAATGPSGMCGS